MGQAMTKKTIITRKQAGVIYRSVKQGALTMSKKAVSAMYDVTDFDVRDYDYVDPIADQVERLLLVVDAIFAGDLSTAQAKLDAYSAIYAA